MGGANRGWGVTPGVNPVSSPGWLGSGLVGSRGYGVGLRVVGLRVVGLVFFERHTDVSLSGRLLLTTGFCGCRNGQQCSGLADAGFSKLTLAWGRQVRCRQ